MKNYSSFRCPKKYENFVLAFFIVIIFTMILISFSSCKSTKIEYVPIEKTKIEYHDKYLRDSIFQQDSVYVREKGDTVWFERYKYLYVDKIRHDSIFIHDSIPIPYPVEIEKFTNKITWWQQTKMYAGVVLLAGILIIVGFNIVKKKYFPL